MMKKIPRWRPLTKRHRAHISGAAQQQPTNERLQKAKNGCIKRGVFFPIDALHNSEPLTNHTVTATMGTYNPVPFTWGPDLVESIDGEPLTTTISGLFHKFPYDRLPSNPYVAIWMRPEFVFASIIFYFASIPTLRFIIEKFCGGYGFSNSDTFRNSVAIHNLALAIFSGVCAWNVWLICLSSATQTTYMTAHCDVGGDLWKNHKLGPWIVAFYISKYYEWIDTWILIAKGKDASFLQTYHHAGIVLSYWAGSSSHASWMMSATLLNATIHTMMYTYFLIKTLYPKVQIKAAKYLTMAQITQFIIGNSLSLCVFYLGESCTNRASIFTLTFMVAYVSFLVTLFVAFANKKYKVKKT